MRAENNVIRIMWSVPNGALCDAFLVNYTVLSLTHPKSYSIATVDESTLIKFFTNHTLDLRVFCMLAGSLSKTWWAHRIAYLKSPLSVNGLHVIWSETDEFCIARVSIEWTWPTVKNFDLFKIVVSYGIGKQECLRENLSEVGPVILDKLKPAQKYRIVVRNESIELGLKSKTAELETITPPLISSTLFPGPISSTAININFAGTDLEQGRFDHYELVLIANNSRNITKRIEKQQEKSMTFTELIPGKTYHFALFTAYKGMRSRAVTKSVTTYPLKVNALYPVVGYEYVVLYWNVENYADCRFRLSYNADKVGTVSVNLKGVNRHRFDGLLPNIYYTFTITVIMGVGKATAESESEMITVYVPRLCGLLFPFSMFYVFSSLNGALDNIAVIVSDDISLNDDDYELRSWFEVKDDETWGSYRASSSLWQPFTENSNSANFTIGTDDCRRQSFDEPYCNGILRANVAYKVKLRAYMNTNVAMESDWIQIVGTEVEKPDFGKRKRRFPCHMYLNGCPRKSAAITYKLPTVLCATIVLRLLN
ncbi:unnamed protein product [Angiostrongylus costaricensis]|uniref:protein-tyrosine-phosphatase n=1 Tax=Angiostrongylus costaricensis TaxID=334426 RepID=A0A0R3PVF3_ANGCS|nr:unnamed protein product [Angiostrongylus costaricensis]